MPGIVARAIVERRWAAILGSHARRNRWRHRRLLSSPVSPAANADGGVDRVAYSQPLSRAIRAASIRLFALSLLIVSEM